MGKKKDQFIDKSKAITFKLSYRDNDDPFFKKQEGVSGSEVVERVFEVKSMPMDSSLTEEERQKRDKLLSLFSEEDQGKFKQEKKIEKEEPIGSKYWVPPEIRAKLAGKSLWIDQLAQKSQLQEQDVEDYEVEELEDVEEGDEQEEEVEEDKQEDEGEEEIATEKARKPNQIHEKMQRRGQSDDESSSNYSDEQSDEGYISNDGQDDDEEEEKAAKPKAEDLTSADFPEFHYKDLVEKKIVEENIMPKYEKIVFNKDVRFKKFNEYGLPVGNGKFDYSKYFVQPSQQNVGVVEATLFADYKKAPRLAEDIDYEYDEMTEEQKEVFDALNADDDAGYEELEENFVNIATDGQKAIVKDEVEEEIKEIVTGKKKDKKNKGKKMHFTFDDEGKVTLQMNEEKKGTKKQPVVKQGNTNNTAQKVVVLKKYQSEESRVNNDAFDKVMKEFEDSDGENDKGFNGKDYDEEKYQGSSDEDYDIPELQNGILTGEGLNKILDDHLADMAGRAHSTLIPHNLMPNKNGISQESEKEQPVVRPSWATRVNENGRRVNIEMEEKQKERMAQYEGFVDVDDIVKRVFVERIPIEKDNALASYLKREEDREANPDAYIENLERPVGENKLDETIATKNFSFSKVHENLSIIGDDINLSRSKKYSRLRAAEEEEEKRKADKEKEKVQEIEEKSSDEEEEEEEEEIDPLKIRSYELSHKIARGETKEEKLARKQALKEFKEARKQKKKMYKEGFEAVAKEQSSKIQNRTNFTNMQNIRGVSIKQIV